MLWTILYKTNINCLLLIFKCLIIENIILYLYFCFNVDTMINKIIILVIRNHNIHCELFVVISNNND